MSEEPESCLNQTKSDEEHRKQPSGRINLDVVKLRPVLYNIVLSYDALYFRQHRCSRILLDEQVLQLDLSHGLFSPPKDVGPVRTVADDQIVFATTYPLGFLVLSEHGVVRAEANDDDVAFLLGSYPSTHLVEGSLVKMFLGCTKQAVGLEEVLAYGVFKYRDFFRHLDEGENRRSCLDAILPVLPARRGIDVVCFLMRDIDVWITGMKAGLVNLLFLYVIAKLGCDVLVSGFVYLPLAFESVVACPVFMMSAIASFIVRELLIRFSGVGLGGGVVDRASFGHVNSFLIFFYPLGIERGLDDLAGPDFRVISHAPQGTTMKDTGKSEANGTTGDPFPPNDGFVLIPQYSSYDHGEESDEVEKSHDDCPFMTSGGLESPPVGYLELKIERDVVVHPGFEGLRRCRGRDDLDSWQFLAAAEGEDPGSWIDLEIAVVLRLHIQDLFLSHRPRVARGRDHIEHFVIDVAGLTHVWNGFLNPFHQTASTGRARFRMCLKQFLQRVEFGVWNLGDLSDLLLHVVELARVVALFGLDQDANLRSEVDSRNQR